MKQALHLQLGQQLKMTPQLQQAIRLLQLSSLDLRQEIQEAVETNPMLELDDNQDHDSLDSLLEAESGDDPEREVDGQSVDVEIDTEWDDAWETAAPASPGAPLDSDEWQTRKVAPTTLHDHLLWQLNLSPMSMVDQAIAYAIIESLDERGFLAAETGELIQASCEALGDDLPDDGIEADEVEAVLHRLQNFDPPGVAARNLGECLTIQLRMLPADTPWREQALQLVGQHLALVEQRDLASLKRRMGLSDAELSDVMALVRSLSPAPGEAMNQSEPDYVVPDVIISRRGKRWQVELNPESLPKVGLNQTYAGMVNQTRNEADSSYMKGQLQEARWLLKSLQSRNETLLKVSTRIVEVQHDFFEYGEEAMKPLVLADVAEAIAMHESTISRVTSQKYMLTPRGIFELKYFFSSHVGTDAGGECSSTAIRAIIKKLVAAEDPRKPLSDNKLSSLLKDQGIQVARRTVAKYREAMRIPASSDRKRLV